MALGSGVRKCEEATQIHSQWYFWSKFYGLVYLTILQDHRRSLLLCEMCWIRIQRSFLEMQHLLEAWRWKGLLGNATSLLLVKSRSDSNLVSQSVQHMRQPTPFVSFVGYSVGFCCQLDWGNSQAMWLNQVHRTQNAEQNCEQKDTNYGYLESSILWDFAGVPQHLSSNLGRTAFQV